MHTTVWLMQQPTCLVHLTENDCNLSPKLIKLSFFFAKNLFVHLDKKFVNMPKQNRETAKVTKPCALPMNKSETCSTDYSWCLTSVNNEYILTYAAWFCLLGISESNMPVETGRHRKFIVSNSHNSTRLTRLSGWDTTTCIQQLKYFNVFLRDEIL